MRPEDDWNIIHRTSQPISAFGMGLLRFALLFGSAAIALALLAVPFLQGGSRTGGMQMTSNGGIDYTATGSIRRTDASYTIRRSVLQKSPDAICVIRQDGSRHGDC